MEIKLIKPTLEYANDIMKYRREFLELGDDMAGCGNLRDCSSAKEWIDRIDLLESKETCPSDMVTSNTYIAVRLTDNKIVGVIDFRHNIDNHPILSVWGGHIGYSVRPCERKKGYATEILRQNIINCKEYGLDKILITCDYDNVGSEKVILANRGVFESDIEADGTIKKRYWIKL
ncbi:N-acetyltransferase GCN5 [[Clostridium] sordellii]|uniref:GNAT family N-acetyltransferase n=1 Tax=Paraclostridium sordellii TaxID=1505 RepID=UPI0005E37760|nr:GNAT family N-acetyltransferase [Paeniclostridium sordellii]CEN23767.1 N-acetyltransferase GCN5 [[Clostridium] sordellii] [Paeniclostridium sordellii]